MSILWRLALLLVAIAALVLVLTACGSDAPEELHQLDGIEDTLMSPLSTPTPTP